jgi:hypothetical protein
MTTLLITSRQGRFLLSRDRISPAAADLVTDFNRLDDRRFHKQLTVPAGTV